MVARGGHSQQNVRTLGVNGILTTAPEHTHVIKSTLDNWDDLIEKNKKAVISATLGFWVLQS